MTHLHPDASGCPPTKKSSLGREIAGERGEKVAVKAMLPTKPNIAINPRTLIIPNDQRFSHSTVPKPTPASTPSTQILKPLSTYRRHSLIRFAFLSIFLCALLATTHIAAHYLSGRSPQQSPQQQHSNHNPSNSGGGGQYGESHYHGHREPRQARQASSSGKVQRSASPAAGKDAPLSIEDRMEYAGIIMSKDLTRVMFRDHSAIAYHSFAVEVDVRGALNISLFDAVEGSKADLAERRKIVEHENALLDQSIIDRCGLLSHADLNAEQGEARYMEAPYDYDTADHEGGRGGQLQRVPEGGDGRYQHQPYQYHGRRGGRKKRVAHYVTSFIGSVLYTFAFPALLTIWNTVQQLQIFNIRDELDEQWRRIELIRDDVSGINREWQRAVEDHLVKGFNEATSRLYMSAYRGIARAERKLQLQAIDRLLATGKIGHSLFPGEQVRSTLRMLYASERAFNATPYSADINLFYDLARVLNGKYNSETGRLRLQIYAPSFEGQGGPKSSSGGASAQIYDVYSIIHRGEITRDERKYVFFELPTQVACNRSVCIPLSLEECAVLPATNLFDCPLRANTHGVEGTFADSGWGSEEVLSMAALGASMRAKARRDIMGSWGGVRGEDGLLLNTNGDLMGSGGGGRRGRFLGLLPDELANYPLRVIDTYRHFVYERKFKGHTVTATTLTVYKNTTVPNSGVLVSLESGAWSNDGTHQSAPIQIYQMHDPILFPSLESDLFTHLPGGNFTFGGDSKNSSMEGRLRLIQERRRDNSIIFKFDKWLDSQRANIMGTLSDGLSGRSSGGGGFLAQATNFLYMLLIGAAVVFALLLALLLACCMCGCMGSCGAVRSFYEAAVQGFSTCICVPLQRMKSRGEGKEEGKNVEKVGKKGASLNQVEPADGDGRSKHRASSPRHRRRRSGSASSFAGMHSCYLLSGAEQGLNGAAVASLPPQSGTLPTTARAVRLGIVTAAGVDEHGGQLHDHHHHHGQHFHQKSVAFITAAAPQQPSNKAKAAPLPPPSMNRRTSSLSTSTTTGTTTTASSSNNSSSKYTAASTSQLSPSCSGVSDETPTVTSPGYSYLVTASEASSDTHGKMRDFADFAVGMGRQKPVVSLATVNARREYINEPLVKAPKGENGAEKGCEGVISSSTSSRKKRWSMAMAQRNGEQQGAGQFTNILLRAE